MSLDSSSKVRIAYYFEPNFWTSFDLYIKHIVMNTYREVTNANKS